MTKIGVVEGFFGPQWNDDSRLSYASFLAQHQGSFYIYAPKQDQYLRKSWREDWPHDYIEKLTKLTQHFHHHQIKFGVGFSPFALGLVVTDDDKKILKQKIEIFNSLKLDMLGLFFDDMPTNENLAATQMEVLHIVTSTFKNKVIFCPTYYTFDPILEKVFGKRPDHYLEDIAKNSPLQVAIAWTGPKVISTEIPDEHLKETSLLLKRPPFIWENYFANDGPRNCKFLKLKPYAGRSNQCLSLSEGHGFNLMNQPELSKILFLASKFSLIDALESEVAFKKAITKLCPKALEEIILNNRETFLNEGLDKINDTDKISLLEKLKLINHPISSEIINWLNGEYNVGSECLTD